MVLLAVEIAAARLNPNLTIQAQLLFTRYRIPQLGFLFLGIWLIKA